MSIQTRIKYSKSKNFDKASKIALCGYISLLIGILFPIAFVLGLTWLFLFRNTADLYLKSHIIYLTRTTICGLYVITISLLLNDLFQSDLFFIPPIIWCLYRCINGGLLCLFKSQPYK